MKGTPTKRDLLAMLEDLTHQRNELQLLLCACVSRAGGEVTLGGGLLRGLMGKGIGVTLEKDGDGYRVNLEFPTTALPDEDATWRCPVWAPPRRPRGRGGPRACGSSAARSRSARGHPSRCRRARRG